MNVAIFASAFHPHLGGVEELCRQLAHELTRRGHAPIILTNRWPRNLPAFERFEGLPVFRLPFRTSEESLKSKASYRLTHKRICAELLRILDDHSIDVMHVQCVSSNAAYALRARELRPRPLVVTLQGELTMDASRLFERSETARATMRAALEQADWVTACSRQTLAEAEAFLGKSLSGKSEVIHNGIRCADFTEMTPYPHPRSYILAMGRLVPQKGFDVLLDAVALLVRENVWTGDLLLAGDGPEREALECRAAQLGIGPRISFVGRADRERAVSLFAGCQLFVLPSRREPFGIVNLEAMAANKPVIATRVGGVPEFVEHAKTGWLVPPENPRALADAVRHLLGNPDQCETLTRNGRELAEAHDWSHVTESYLAAYQIVTRTHENLLCYLAG